MRTEFMAPSAVAIWPDAEAAQAVIDRDVMKNRGLREAAGRVNGLPCIGCGVFPPRGQTNAGLYIPNEGPPLMFYACCTGCVNSRAGVERSESAWIGRFGQ